MSIVTIIESIRTELEQLTWLEKSYGRAWTHSELRNGKALKFPKCFDGANYENVFPSAKYKAQSFIYARTPERQESNSRDGNNFKTRDLSVIVWGNLKKIDPIKTGIFISDLKKDVELILISVPEVASINQVFDEKAEDIFQGFSITDVETQFLMYPYAGLRFDLTVKYQETLC